MSVTSTRLSIFAETQKIITLLYIWKAWRSKQAINLILMVMIPSVAWCPPSLSCDKSTQTSLRLLKQLTGKYGHWRIYYISVKLSFYKFMFYICPFFNSWNDCVWLDFNIDGSCRRQPARWYLWYLIVGGLYKRPHCNQEDGRQL